MLLGVSLSSALTSKFLQISAYRGWGCANHLSLEYARCLLVAERHRSEISPRCWEIFPSACSDTQGKCHPYSVSLPSCLCILFPCCFHKSKHFAVSRTFCYPLLLLANAVREMPVFLFSSNQPNYFFYKALVPGLGCWFTFVGVCSPPPNLGRQSVVQGAQTF